MRIVRLIIAIAVGYVIGNVVTGLGLRLVGIASSDGAEGLLRTVLLLGGGGLGAFAGFLSWRARNAPVQSNSHGSARFGDEKAAAKSLGDNDGLIVGRAAKGWLMRYAGPAHLLTLAPTSGKGVGAIIPNLLTANRSVICIDPKGENTRITARARAGFGPVLVLDPFEISGQPSAGFNPLAGLDPEAIDVAEDAMLIADSLVYDPPGQVGEAHWNEEAKALIAGLILQVVTTDTLNGSLTRVREILTLPPRQFEVQLIAMQKNAAVGGLVARAANRHLGKSDREATGVLSSAQRHTHFLDSPRMARLLSRSDFRFGDLKQDVATVFLVLPPERLATHARWLRLMVAQAVHDLARSAPSSDGVAPGSVLFMLDEFAALGPLEPIERAFGLMAGYGVQLWAILQDLHQLKGLYGERAGTFLSNAGAIQVFNVADVDTASWVSRMLGATTEAFYTTASTISHPPNQWFATHGSSTSLNLTRRDLMTPDEVMTMNQDQLLLLRPGKWALAPHKVRYYADREFQGLFDA